MKWTSLNDLRAKYLSFFESKLGNPNFTSKAPQKVIDEIREKEAKVKSLIKNLEDSYNAL